MFRKRLQAIAARLDAPVVSLVAGDGLPVESHVTLEDFDVEALAAELTTQVRAIADDHGDLKIGSVRQLSITTDDFVVMMGSLPESYFLLVILSRPASVGRARFELRRAPLAFESDLA